MSWLFSRARWKAQDADGTWHWFECQPRYNKRLGTWTALKGETVEVGSPRSQ